MTDGRGWLKADDAIGEAEYALKHGVGPITERAQLAVIPLAALGEEDVPGWMWALVEQAVALGSKDDLGEAEADAFASSVTNLRGQLEGLLEDDDSGLFLCPRCKLPLIRGRVTMRRGLFGRMGGGDGLMVRFEPDGGGKRQTLIEAVDPVIAHVCDVCEGVFLERDIEA